jgi:hypothetical protein
MNQPPFVGGGETSVEGEVVLMYGMLVRYYPPVARTLRGG